MVNDDYCSLLYEAYPGSKVQGAVMSGGGGVQKQTRAGQRTRFKVRSYPGSWVQGKVIY